MYQRLSWHDPLLLHKFGPGQGVASDGGTCHRGARLSDVNFVEFGRAKYVFCLTPKFFETMRVARLSKLA